MPQRKRHESAAERQKAYRERKKREQESGEGGASEARRPSPDLGTEPGPAKQREHLLQREEPNRQEQDSGDAPAPSAPDEPQPEQVVTPEDQQKLAWQAELERAFEAGYVGEPAPYGSASPMKPREAALTTEWARGVWARQAEQMPAGISPDMKAKLRAQLKGEAPPPKKRSSWD